MTQLLTNHGAFPAYFTQLKDTPSRCPPCGVIEAGSFHYLIISNCAGLDGPRSRLCPRQVRSGYHHLCEERTKKICPHKTGRRISKTIATCMMCCTIYICKCYYLYVCIICLLLPLLSRLLYLYFINKPRIQNQRMGSLAI